MRAVLLYSTLFLITTALAEHDWILHRIRKRSASDVSWALDRINQRNETHLDGKIENVAIGDLYVVGSGVRGTHSEFGGRVKDGWSFDGSDSREDCGKIGTAAASVAAGENLGVSREGHVIPVKVTCYGSAGEAVLRRAADWIAGDITRENGRRAVVLLTFSLSAAEVKLFSRIAETTLVVVPAGDNAENECSNYQNREVGFLIVASSNRDDAQSSFSNHGSCVDLFAPGEDIRTAGNSDDTALSSPSSSTAYSAAATAGVALQNAIEIKEVGDVVTLKSLLLGHSTKNVLTRVSKDTPNKLLFDICPYYKLPEHGKCYVAQTEQDSEKKMDNLAKSVITFDYSNYNYYKTCFKGVVFRSNVTSTVIEMVHKYDTSLLKHLLPVFVISTKKSVIELHPGPRIYIDGTLLEGRTLASPNEEDWYMIQHESRAVPNSQSIAHKIVPVVTVSLPDDITVQYDGVQEIAIELGDAQKFYEQTEGICGFYDKSHVIEFVDKEGRHMEQTGDTQKRKYVDEWTSDEYDCKEVDELCESNPRCHSIAEDVCSALKNRAGDFNACFDKLDPEPWYRNCVDAVEECCCKEANTEECACTEQRKYWWAAFTSGCAVPPPCEKRCEKPERDPECKDDSKNKMEYVYEGTIKYSPKDSCHCNPEHDEIVCHHDGTWNKQVPDCKIKSCPVPGETNLAPIVAGKKDSYNCGDKVTYGCSKTECDCNCYEMRGAATATCVGTAEDAAGECAAGWGSDPPTCTLKYCPDPQKPNVDININSDKELSSVVVAGKECCSGRVTYHCHECYTLEGASEHTCCNSAWGDGSIPTCRLKQCQDPKDEVAASKDPHLVVVYTELYCSSTVRYSCNDNCYQLVGAEARTCGSNGEWSGELPRCELKKCPPLQPTYDNGYYSFAGKRLTESKELSCGDKVEAHCDNCYYPCSSVCSRSCSWNGTDTVWDADFPLCARRLCPPRVVENAVIVKSQGPVKCGQSSTAKCNMCYKAVSGDAERTCRVSDRSANTCPPTHTDGDYDGEELVCKPMTCPKLDIPWPLEIENKTCTNEMECDCTVQFKCPTCYDLKGPTTLRCSGEGWDDNVPTCERRTCNIPEVYYDYSRRYMPPAEGGCQFWRGDELIGEESTIYCNDTLHVKANFSDCNHVCGIKELTCNGPTWSPANKNEHALCYLIRCGNAEEGENARIMERRNKDGEVIQYVNGDGELVCKNKRDEGERPECHDVVTYQCDKCHKLKTGDLERTCVAVDVEKKWTGRWNGTKPVCEKMTCDEAAPVIVNGTVISDNTECGNTVMYECNKCNRLVGDNNVKCEQPLLGSLATTWAHTPPTCEPICCPPITPVMSTDEDYQKIATNVRYVHGPIQLHVTKMLMSTSQNYDTCNENYVCQQVEAKCDECFEYQEGEYAPVRECVKYSTMGDNGVEAVYGKWTNEDKVCIRKTCSKRDLDSQIHHAHYKNPTMTGSTKCNQTVEIECDCCHALSDSQITVTQQCLSDKTWSSILPVCTPVQCASPPPLEHGSWKAMKPSDSCSCGEVQYTCDPCYRLVGASTVTCVQDQGKGTASWSSPPPVCEPMCCEHLENPKDSYLNEVTSKYHYLKDFRETMPLTLEQMSVKDFYDTCRMDYVCQKLQPKCTECFEYTERDAAAVDGVAQPPIMECVKSSTTGVWTNRDKHCTIKKCKYRQPPEHSSYEGSYNEDSIARCRDEVTVKCDECFELADGTVSETYTCLASKLWSKPMSPCQRKQCSQPPAVSHCTYTEGGGNDCHNSRVLQCDDCYYHDSCHNDEQLTAALTVKCGADKQWSWSEEIPVLKRRYCSPPPQLPHGSVAFDRSDNFRCGSEVRYTCNRCYAFSHDARCSCENRKCIPDPNDCTKGMWNETAPACEKITCPTPDNIEHGKIVSADATCDGAVKYECDEGYYLIDGDLQRNCTDQGTWSGKLPRCQIKMCTAIEDSPNRETNLTRPDNTPYGTFVKFQCMSCHELQASAVDPMTLKTKTVYPRYYLLYCQASGNWNGSSPVCRQQMCKKPSAPLNGQIVDVKSSYACGDNLQFKCNEGYQFRDGSVRSIRCEGNIWSSSERPECVPVDCGELTVKEPLTLETTGDTLYGNEGVYSCGKGRHRSCYEDLQLKETECLPTGQWSYKALASQCKRMDCGALPSVPNGNVRVRFNKRPDTDCLQQVFISCEKGYRLSGTSYQACRNINGKMKWWPPNPRCEPKECKVLLKPHMGEVIPSAEEQERLPSTRYIRQTIKYSCSDPCYQLSHSEYRQCEENSNGIMVWTSKEPICNLITCNVPAVANGVIKTYTSSFKPHCGSNITVICDKGYSLDHDDEVWCTSSGNYNTRLPKCVAVICEQVKHEGLITEFVPFGELSTEAEPRHLSTYKFTCTEGYELVTEEGVTNSEITCLRSGLWNFKPPKCKFKECETFAEVDNGVVRLSEDGKEVSVTCNTCYRLNSIQEKFYCNNGRWQPPTPPTCEVITCPNPGVPSNGLIARDTSSGLEYVCNDTVTYACIAGYSLLGPASTIICDGYTGTWSEKHPVCSKKSCPKLPPIENGVSNISPEGSSITYICNEGYRIYGNAIRKCLNGTQWDGPGHTECHLNHCGDVGRIQYGKVRVSKFGLGKYNDTLGAVVTYSCNDDRYQLIGSSQRQCTANREWDLEPPQCKCVQCHPLSIDNGYIRSNDDNKVGTTILYECNEGYELVGIRRRKCLDSGEWEGTDPICQKIRCPRPSLLDGATFKVPPKKEYLYLEKVSVVCQQFQNELVYQCGDDGVWTGDVDKSCSNCRLETFTEKKKVRAENPGKCNGQPCYGAKTTELEESVSEDKVVCD